MSGIDHTGEPLISVVIATRNRAEMLRDSIHSVLCQTYSNIEVIVIDDGSEDDTARVVDELGDSRLRYAFQEHAGISAARNHGTRLARGEWLAVHDDDDIMLPSRLAEQLAHVGGDVDFIYGTFLNFDDETGEFQLHHGRNYGYGPALMSGFAPGHSTWLVRTEVMRRFPYDEGIESAVDNNVVFRMLRSGVRFRHSGVYCLLRRVHSGRITDTGGAGQKYVAGLNLAYLNRGVSSEARDRLVKSSRRDWGPVDKTRWQTRFMPYLPDHLVVRTGYLTSTSPVAVEEGAEMPIPTVRLETTDVSAMDWWAFYEASSRAADSSSVRARPRESKEIEDLIAPTDAAAALDLADVPLEVLSLLFKIAAESAPSDYFAVVGVRSDEWTPQQFELTVARCIASVDGRELTMGLVPLRSWSAAEAIREAVFPGALSFRVFSTRPLDAIVAELDAPA
jgi:hypothetical protein